MVPKKRLEVEPIGSPTRYDRIPELTGMDRLEFTRSIDRENRKVFDIGDYVLAPFGMPRKVVATVTRIKSARIEADLWLDCKDEPFLCRYRAEDLIPLTAEEAANYNPSDYF